MPKADTKSSKKLADDLYDAHFGVFDPSDQIDKTSSSNNRSSSSGNPQKPKQTSNKQSRTTQSKEKCFHPTGHAVMEMAPYTRVSSNPTEHSQATALANTSISDSFQNASSQEEGKSGEPKTLKLCFHRDLLKRDLVDFDTSEKFLNPYDGNLCTLIVQSSQSVLQSNPMATWYRTKLRNGSPWMIRISNWAMSRDFVPEDSVRTNTSQAAQRWIPACIALAFVTSLPIQVAATPSNFGRYDPFLYKDWNYPREARNKAENKGKENISNELPRASNQTPATIGRRERLVEPDYLCFIGTDNKVQAAKVSDWNKDSERMTTTDYVFVSFFSGHFSNDERSNEYLKHVGITAARHVGVSAYWISTSCLYDFRETDAQKIKGQIEQSVWNMSDIIRRARAIAIAVPGPLDPNCNGKSIKEWGTRFWTMPELLLHTGDAPVLVFDQELDEQRSIPRRELWNKAWSDTALSGQLIDHYEGSLILTQLELCTVALHCLQNRSTTKIYLPGDLAYVLMGLLRQRPEIVASDSEFQAFARLSLANDSNSLLERLICLLPTSLDSEWWSLDDAWNVALWDIYPKIQICGLGDDDSVILDGARGAAIRWDKFVPVRTLGEETMRHRLVRWLVRGMPGTFLAGILWTAVSAYMESKSHAVPAYAESESNAVPAYGETKSNAASPFLAFGGCLLGVSFVVILFLPYLLHMIYYVKTHNSQPFFFGFEGYLDIYNLELLIFGSYEGRLGWSTTGSPLSRHGPDKIDTKQFSGSISKVEELEKEQNLCTGLDPKQRGSKTEKLVEGAESNSHQDKKVFTLVDTYTMTVTLFEAVRPPIAVIVCGAEGGMQRALLCSEDWKSGTLYRETVLRMETRVWDKMDTLARIRLGLKTENRKKALTDPKNFKVKRASWLSWLAGAIGSRI